MNTGSMGSSSGRRSADGNEEMEMPRLAISTLQEREEEIEKKKMEVKEKVDLQLGRAEEATRCLLQILLFQELEVLDDPMRKEVAIVRKKIDMANREQKCLGQSCHKKVEHRPPSLQILLCI